MTTRALTVVVLCFAAVTATRAGLPVPVPELRAVEKRAGADYAGKSYASMRDGFERLSRAYPGQPRWTYNLAAAEALAGHTDAALAALERLARMKLAYDVAADDDFASLRSDPRFRDLCARLAANARPIAAAAHVMDLGAPDTIPEDIARDPATGTLYVSSVRHRGILSIDARGRSTDFVTQGRDGLWGVFALGIDAPRHLLWATTAAVPVTPGLAPADAGRTALVAYDLAGGKQVRRIELPKDPAQRQSLGDLTVGPDGTVYVSDGAAGAVYRLAPGASALDPLVPAGTLVSPQTPALAADGRRLFVPDYGLGIAVVDLGDRTVTMLPAAGDVATTGIDGLYLAGDALIAVQNGTNPERIVRLRLDRAQARILSCDVLESASPGLGDPTHGLVEKGAFLFIADSGWDRYDREGKPRADAPPARPALRRIDLSK